jgi:D-cysteine desulfhydrase family pyridoxal phosphate-dependent enzyme
MVDVGRLEEYRRVPLAVAPTPLEPLERLGEAIGVRNLWTKRDDLTGLAEGGNKARKLEYLMADAEDRGCDHIVTTGGRQSNSCRMTAAAANRSGMGCTLVLGDPDPGTRQGNLLLDDLLGAELVFIGDAHVDDMMAAVDREMERLKGEGKKPYAIPVGGSTPLGELGYVRAAREFAEQAEGLGIDTVVLAVGSCGTIAGLALGLKMFTRGIRLIGISVSRNVNNMTVNIPAMANEAADLLGVDTRVTAEDVELTDAFVGPRYGVPSDAGLEAMRLTARTEGILLDPIYTGKAMSGLIGYARDDAFAASEGVCFWHTGGLPALYAFNDEIERFLTTEA